jgi:hypothetical protein
MFAQRYLSVRTERTDNLALEAATRIGSCHVWQRFVTLQSRR